LVVQPGQDWDGDYDAGPLDCPTQRRVFAQGQVRAHLIVIRRVRRKNLPQVRLAKDQHPIETLASHGANQALHVSILPWGPDRLRCRSGLGYEARVFAGQSDVLRTQFERRVPPRRVLCGSRKIVVADLLRIVQWADKLAAKGATVGVHLDNVHKLDADGLATIFNEYLEGVETAKQQGLVAKTRTVGYIAKNNPSAFLTALEHGSLAAAPLYQINENASLSEDGTLDSDSRVAQQIGRRYGIPVFLKTFGTDVAYTTEYDGKPASIHVSPEMTAQMAQLPDIAGAAWSADEARYHPTLFAQGSVVREVRFPYRSRVVRRTE
jgi:hypothetical protein